MRETQGAREPTIPRSRWRCSGCAGTSIRGRGMCVHWPKKGIPERAGQLSECLGPWQPRHALCRGLHRDGRGDGQSVDIESDVPASHKRISFFQDLEPNWFRRARLTSPADSRRAPGIWMFFTCTRTGAGGRTAPSRDTTVRPPAPHKGLMGTTSPFETHRGTHKPPGQRLVGPPLS